ncbi:MAG: hypothetical protein KI786_05710 [Mameliella sp.]|nr:hypothetical protein [Phaeodactylibacter sp.]
MITLNEMAYRLLDLKDLKPDVHWIRSTAFSIVDTRALLIRRDLQNGTRVSEHIIQHIPIMEVVKANLIEEDCYDLPLNCVYYRTKEKIPEPIKAKGFDGFTYVGTIDGKTPFSPKREALLGLKTGSRWSCAVENENSYFYRNGYIFITGPSKRYIRISGVYEDPIAVMELLKCGEDIPCDPFERKFPVSRDLSARIRQALISTELQFPERDDYQVNINE